MRGKSRGSVRESGDSVQRLEGCLGARACTFGELGARGQACASMHGRGRGSGAREVLGWRVTARGARSWRARARGGIRGWTLERAGACGYGCTPFNEDEDECEPSILNVEEPKALMSIDEGLSFVFKLLGIFMQECKLAFCIEEEEEASRAKGDSSWASRRSHDRRGKTEKKLGSRLVAYSKFVV
ncbi:hypothetical protein CDL15_Pgr008664 [Punica granatum]|uniref:Uncharacterized protein n=1 Tax=Punica granatum TaxID=22663 RepID=A0A218XCW5_PUNGR|nr:hypothetical protein CDL15_Pgr008664 [Punica granatum]